MWRSFITPETRAAFAALFRLSWPVVAARVGIMLMALLDTIVVGRYSTAQLGFLMQAQALHWVPALTGMGLLMGVQVKTAHFLGSNEPHRIGAVVRRGLGYALILGVGCMIVLIAAGPAFLRATVQPDIAQGAYLPLILFSSSLPVFLCGIVATQFLEALGRTRDVLIATLLANALNVVLLLWLVPGHVSLFGITCNGAAGAAAATLIARTLQAGGLLIYVVWMRAARPFNLLGRQPPDHDGAVEQRHVGYATGAAYFIEVAAFSGMTVFAGHVGEMAVAAWSIVLNFAGVIFMVPMGLSAGCSVLVGRAYGAGDRAGVARMGRVSFMTATLFTLGVVVLVLIFSEPVTRFYTHDPLLIPVVRHGLLLACLFFVPDGLQVVGAQALRARRDILAPTVIHYVSYGAIMLPLGFIFCLTLNLGVAGLIYAVVVASLIAGGFQTARFLWLDKKPVPIST
ncbi:MATE family efflux transporter [Asticcacaulis sp. EMRT-3]|uniref:MATE family efflux transporter n=1 Tax=Asticcacaulis sp. EMRT-3 TaxID=3040349 RepID=UPI0024AEF1BC|nr:MATE family efflux transporter [Asticcacaulis sp. EMRT-3]MDI7774251.1 MATE family efflux transporter [Asticcacaulis sp. EMRT-3]